MPTVERDCTPDEAVAMAMDLAATGRLKEAETILRSVLLVVPDHRKAMNELGNCCFKRGDLFEALYRYDRGVRVDKSNAAVRSNRAMILSELGHLDEAEADFRIALHHGPKQPVVWNNFANVLERREKFTEALHAVEKTLALDPGHALSHMNKGTILYAMGDLAGAVRCHDRAIELDPTLSDAHYNRAIALLKSGDFEAGFPAYEWRLKNSQEPIYYVDSPAPRWTGEPLEGKTILLHAEQGLGDTIQFLRYVDYLLFHAAPAKVLLIVHKALRSLCIDSFATWPKVEVLEPGTEMPAHDFVCPLMSLPAVFKTTLETIPPPLEVRELSYNCPDCNRWGGLIGDNLSRGEALRVGICWSGNFQHKNDAHRSIPLSVFGDLLGVRGVRYFSLQQQVRVEDAKAFDPLPAGIIPDLLFTDLGPHLTDMRQTAHAMGWLDLVITVDTAVAHLAATMGVETWILIPAFKSDWRWLTGRSDSPWYPNVSLLRQQTKGDWSAVIRDARGNLMRRAAAQAA